MAKSLNDYPNHPKECLEVLTERYRLAYDHIITDLEWAIFSGAFSRHVQEKIRRCGAKKGDAFKYIHTLCQSYTRMLHVKRNVFKVMQQVQEIAHMNKIKEKLDDCLGEIK